MKIITKAEVLPLLQTLRGKFFTVEFIKRTTGERRVMNCTTNYESKLAGGEPAYDFNEKQLIPVWDLGKRAFRSIPLDSVLVIKANGIVFQVK